MAFLTLFAVGVALLGTAVWYLLGQNEAKTRAAFEARKVRYVPQPNALLQSIKKERMEVSRDEIIKREGKTFGFNFLNSYTILCAEPEMAQLVLSKEFTNFTNRRRIFTSDDFFSTALGSVRDEQWKRLRAIVTPTFSAGKLRAMKPAVDDVIRNMNKNFVDVLQKKGSVINVKQIFGAFTMDTVIQVAFGTKVDSLVEPDNPIIKNARALFSTDMSWANIIKFTMMFMTPRLSELLKIRLFPDEVDFFNRFSQQIIEKKRAEFNKGQHGKATSFIEFLLEAKFEEERLMSQNGVANGTANGTANGIGSKQSKYLTSVELVSQCIQFFLAGYDTTATAISMSAYSIAVNPETQEKLYKEITQVIAKLAEEAGPNGPKDPIELITIESLSRFEYLNAVVNETLRLYSPAAFTERQVTKDTVLETEDGSVKFHVKKDDIIQFPIYSMHRDPTQFPDPEAFKPERFIGEQTFHKYAYLPFGAGPRNCVARSLALLEVKLALLHAVRQYKFSVAKETKVPPEFYYQGQVIIPKDINLKVERR